MNSIANGILMHLGVSVLDGAPGPGSGRYPRGSGENPYQHGGEDFITRYKQLKANGMTESEIVEAMHCKSSTELRTKYSQAYHEKRNAQIQAIRAAMAKGKSKSEISRDMNIPMSTINSLLNEKSEVKKICLKLLLIFSNHKLMKKE